jgi:hypothetical protein
MKPNFSLILSGEGMSLVHRTYSGWARVGDVTFDNPDMPGAISALQDRAQRVPGDRSCKLIIPEDQIKYLTLEAEGDPDAAVRAALEGATPYAVEELEYDWTAEGGVIRVAAVALETLGEAESFAVEHGFEPVSFAAIPAQGDFGGEPFFGATRWAATALPEGTTIERDAAPVRVTGDAEMPKDDVIEDAGPVAAAATKAVADAGPAPKPQKDPAEDTDPAADKAEDKAEAKPEGKVEGKVEDKAASPKGTAPTTAQNDAPADSPAPVTPKSPADAASSSASAAPAPTPKKEALGDIAPTSFSSIRASRDMDNAPRAPLAAGQPRLSRLDGADTAPAASAAPRLPSPADNSATDPVLMAELAASLLPDPEARLDRDAGAETQQAPTDGSALPGLFGKREVKGAQDPTPKSKGSASRRSEDERQRMTVFGARQSEVRGKPRFLGLILTALLLLFLVGVAAWASVFLDDGLARLFRGGDIKLADVPATDETQDDLSAEDAADSAPALIAPLPDGTADARIASLPDGVAPRPEVTSLPDRPLPLSPSEALARYAATGIWQMAPAPPETPGAGAPITDLYQVSLDPGIDLGIPASLPRRAPDARDKAPETSSDPPPAGTRFDFDERGFVRATPEGAMTPEGVRIVAGSPPLTPPADMAQTVTVTAEVPSAGADAGADAAPGTQTEMIVFTGDPALASVRPRARPRSSLAGSDGTEEEESGATQVPGTLDTSIAETGDGAVGSASSLAALRPQPRPEQMTAAAATLTSAAGAAAAPLVDGAALTRAIAAASAQPEVAITQDPEELDDDAFDNATPQAVTASLTPLRRPGDFDTTVKRALANTEAQPVPTSQQIQPSLPSSASVAKQATTNDVLNMREVNLIGVYGSTASRRALVRLGNGRYKKVRVGDTLDGGQVAAIGESELRYVKRGRNVVLRMPQG